MLINRQDDSVVTKRVTDKDTKIESCLKQGDFISSLNILNHKNKSLVNISDNFQYKIGTPLLSDLIIHKIQKRGYKTVINDDYIILADYSYDNTRGSVYVYDINNNFAETKLTASDGAINDKFGYSIAANENYLVVGAPWGDDKGSYSGSVYVYDINNNFTETKLIASDGAAGDYFGTSIAISDNYIVVGAYGDDDNGSISGSIYVYDLNNNFAETKLTASDGDPDDYFGFSVAINDNYLVVGAYRDDDKGSSSGSIYVYDLNNNFAETKLTAPDGASGDYFGWSMAISDNYLVVGAYGDDDNGSSSGSAYVYDINNNFAETKLTASDGGAGDYFGFSVAINDNYLVVGAYLANNKRGSSYIYDINNSFTETKILPSDIEVDYYFGYYPAISDNYLVITGDKSSKYFCI
jgi:hypothetical protein